jgi:hypothetical protein
LYLTAWEAEVSVGKEVLADSIALGSKDLRAKSRQWLQDHRIVAKPFATSSNKKTLSLIADCDSCTSCTKKWCFSTQVQSNSSTSAFVIETTGECTGEKNVKRLKREHARRFAATGTPLKA